MPIANQVLGVFGVLPNEIFLACSPPTVPRLQIFGGTVLVRLRAAPIGILLWTLGLYIPKYYFMGGE
jgi:hypothetical protein